MWTPPKTCRDLNPPIPNVRATMRVMIAVEALLLAMFVQTVIWALRALLTISLVLAACR